MKLMEIQENARKEKCFRDSEWDLQFHFQVALATQKYGAGSYRRKNVDSARSQPVLEKTARPYRFPYR